MALNQRVHLNKAYPYDFVSYSLSDDIIGISYKKNTVIHFRNTDGKPFIHTCGNSILSSLQSPLTILTNSCDTISFSQLCIFGSLVLRRPPLGRFCRLFIDLLVLVACIHNCTVDGNVVLPQFSQNRLYSGNINDVNVTVSETVVFQQLSWESAVLPSLCISRCFHGVLALLCICWRIP